MEYEQRMIIRFLCKAGVSTEDNHPQLEPQFGQNIDSSRVSDGDDSVFDKDVKIYTARFDSRACQLIATDPNYGVTGRKTLSPSLFDY
jgi:hypothetical protein